MEQKIPLEKINKPIQLLAAWLVGLTIVNGSFLTSAIALDDPIWLRATLVIASIVNVPLFLLSIFFLQTKFRPEMQEDAYYSKYLESKMYDYDAKNHEKVVQDLIESERDKIKKITIDSISEILSSSNLGDKSTTLIEQVATKVEEGAAIESSQEKKSKLRLKLYDYKNRPAYYILIYAIVNENVKSEKELRSIESKYRLYPGWEKAILNLLVTEILDGDPENFKINSIYAGLLSEWVSRNSKILNQLVIVTGGEDKKLVRMELASISEMLSFDL